MTQLRIATLAQERGWSMNELSRRSHVGDDTLRRYWHNRIKRWDIDVLERFASTLGVQVSELIQDNK